MQCSPVNSVYAAVAPAFVGQFGAKVTPGKLRAAMKLNLGLRMFLKWRSERTYVRHRKLKISVQEVPEETAVHGNLLLSGMVFYGKKIVSGIQRVYFYGIDSNDAYSKAD